MNYKGNLFERGITEPYDKYDFILLFVKCSKVIVLPDVAKVEPFPSFVYLKKIFDHYQIDNVLFDDIVNYFNKLKSSDSLERIIVVDCGGKQILKRTTKKQKLKKKRSAEIRLLKDLILMLKDRFEFHDLSQTRSLKSFAITINSVMLMSPPGKISEKRFNELILHTNIEDKSLLHNVYKLVGNNYCNQGRISPKNYKDLTRIFLNFKSIDYENQK